MRLTSNRVYERRDDVLARQVASAPMGVCVRRSWRIGAAAAVLPLGVLAVHQGRYFIAFGGRASHVLAEQGDGYAESLLPWLVALVVLGFSVWLLAVARSGRLTASDGPEWGWRRTFMLAVLAAALLFGGYLLQESFEVLAGDTHRSLLTLAFGGGGWLAPVLSGAFGLLWAVVVRGAVRVVALVGRLRRKRSPAVWPVFIPRWIASQPGRAMPSGLAHRLAGRAPPVTLSLI